MQNEYHGVVAGLARGFSIWAKMAASLILSTGLVRAQIDFGKTEAFFQRHCVDCHDAETKKGDLDLAALGRDLASPAVFAQWERLFERVENGEMPPKKKNAPPESDKAGFLVELAKGLTGAHLTRKGTVLRRLNRTEYENTLNDLFGVRLDLAPMLPEEGRSHGFENIGEALNVSMVQLRKYLDAIDLVLDEAIARAEAPPKVQIIRASYAEGSEAKRFIGKVWGLNDDGAVVFFKRSGYPSGMLRGSRTREAGYYKIRVTGYAHRSERPITFSIGGTSFKRGAEKPTFGYHQLFPGEPGTVEIEAWMDENYMVQIEPEEITDRNNELRTAGADKYRGPGLAILGVELEGPLVKEFPSRGHRMIFEGLKRREVPPSNPATRFKSWYVPAFDVETSDPIGDATASLSRVASQAFRRPLEPGQLDPFVGLFKNELAGGRSFEEALRTAIAGIFVSPDFLYLKEKPGRLDAFALASRLSYFLTRTTPDEELLSAARGGGLATDPSALRKQTERLLNDPRVERFTRDFTDAWLDLRNIEFTSPEPKLYPEYDEFLKDSMLGETRAFFAELLKDDLSVDNFIESKFAVLNSRIARHYGISGVEGPEFRRVSLPADSPRGGIMAHASVLKVSANGTSTSPVLRGVWVLERVLGVEPPPPPPAVPGLEPDVRGAKTIRELLEQHREMVSCQGCHKLIDPPGFALESFDPIGGYRERFRSIGQGDRVDLFVNGRKVNYRLGSPVDAGGEMQDGGRFEDFKSFKQVLLQRRGQVARCVAEKLLTFATGREPGFSDRPEIDRIVRGLQNNGSGLRSLIHAIVQSEIFRNK
ncbi:MAG: DUF1592 domain-containing protein [Verrucomicrobiae bacterium]|nr:DUF1592 domain-containing protein [Verrucomicrobiae bacterium]